MLVKKVERVEIGPGAHATGAQERGRSSAGNRPEIEAKVAVQEGGEASASQGVKKTPREHVLCCSQILPQLDKLTEEGSDPPGCGRHSCGNSATGGAHLRAWVTWGQAPP